MSDPVTGDLPPPRFPGLAPRVSAFFLVAVALAVGFMALVAYKQGWLTPHTSVYFLANNALGINKGMPVRLHGFPIGSVEELKLGSPGVEVRLSIDTQYLGRIPKDSQARLARESGVVGATSIDIIPGRAPTPLAENERLDFEPSRTLAEIIDDLRRQMAPAFAELRVVLAQMSKSGEGMPDTLKALREEARRLPETHDQVRKVLGTADRTLVEVARAAKSAESAAISAKSTADEVRASVPAIASKLSTTLDSLGAAASQLNATGEDARETLRAARPAIDRGEVAAREAGEVFSAVKRVWPLNDAFREPERTLTIDSFEARP